MAPDPERKRAPRAGYRLLDAGDGRRLERFGGRLVDRPAPTAMDARRDPGAWSAADLRFDRDGGWHRLTDTGTDGPWSAEVPGLRLHLRPTASGQVGLFPEHLGALPWLRSQVRARSASTVLNLFAYTGLATLALAAAGAAVVHVDAARSAVAWARQNAELSGLADRPIRWIVEDAATFVAREVRRGRRYDGFVLDPPSWGHAKDADAWELDDRLASLLEGCAALSPSGRAFCLLTAHRSGLRPPALRAALAEAFGVRAQAAQAGELTLVADSGARLPLGVAVRLTR